MQKYPTKAKYATFQRLIAAPENRADEQVRGSAGKKQAGKLRKIRLCFIFALSFPPFMINRTAEEGKNTIELWCNGNTADFGSVVLGSSPDSSTFQNCQRLFSKAAFFATDKKRPSDKTQRAAFHYVNFRGNSDKAPLLGRALLLAIRRAYYFLLSVGGMRIRRSCAASGIFVSSLRATGLIFGTTRSIVYFS